MNFQRRDILSGEIREDLSCYLCIPTQLLAYVEVVRHVELDIRIERSSQSLEILETSQLIRSASDNQPLKGTLVQSSQQTWKDLRLREVPQHRRVLHVPSRTSPPSALLALQRVKLLVEAISEAAGRYL